MRSCEVLQLVQMGELIELATEGVIGKVDEIFLCELKLSPVHLKKLVNAVKEEHKEWCIGLLC